MSAVSQPCIPGDQPSELGEEVRGWAELLAAATRRFEMTCGMALCSWDGLGWLCAHESLGLSLVLASVTEQMGSQSKDLLLDSSLT